MQITQKRWPGNRFALMMSVFMLAFALPGIVATAKPLDLVSSVPLVRARQITFQGHLGWVAQNMDGAALVDFSDPHHPVIRRQFTPDMVQPLYWQAFPEEQLIVSADRFRGLVTYDTSFGAQLTTVSALPLTGMTTGFDVTRTTDGAHIAVLSRAGQGLVAVNISNPAAPFITDTFTSGIELTRAAVVRDGIVYAADSEEGGMKVLRLKSPGVFEPLYQVSYPGRLQSLTAAGDYLIAGYNHLGIRIFKFPPDTKQTTPTLEPVVHVMRNRNRVKAAAVGGGYMFTANEQFGIDMLDLSDPAFPVLAGEFVPAETRGLIVQSVAVKDDYLYVSAWDAGILVFKINDGPLPPEFSLENLDASQ